MFRKHTRRGGVTRREMLCRCANGFGGLALASLLAEQQAGAPTEGEQGDTNNAAADTASEGDQGKEG